jgi:hypothetical protein
MEQAHMTKLTQWEWEQAIAKEAIRNPKSLPPAAQWKRNQHVTPRSVSTLVSAKSAPATPARCSVERRGGCAIFWLAEHGAMVAKSLALKREVQALAQSGT